MSVHIDSSDRLVHAREQSLALVCPHCLVTAHVTPSAVPRFDELQAHKPKSIGVVYRCDACQGPIFLRFGVRQYGATRIELSPNFTEVERARARFTFTHLPEPVEALFREALLCYTHGALIAFASMCRRTAQAVFTDLGEPGKLRLFDELREACAMAGIDGPLYARVRTVIFGSDADAPGLPLLDGAEAAVLLEAMKDLLHEAYVRRGRLQQAVTVRRFFELQGSEVA